MAPVSTGPIVRQHFYLLAPDILCVHRRLHPRPAAAHLVLMGAQVLVVDPVTQIHLQFINRSVNLAPECYLIELLLDGFEEAHHRCHWFAAEAPWLGVLDVIDEQVQLVIMRLGFAAILRASVRQDAQHSHALFSKEC